MGRWFVGWLALAAACAGDDPPGDGPTDGPTDGPAPTGDTAATAPTGDTGGPPPALTLTAACVPPEDGNVLRFVCTVTVDPPQPVEVTFAPASGAGPPPRTHRSEDVAAEHLVPLYFLLPKTDYAWTARASGDPASPEVTGLVTTGALPEGARVGLEVEGVSTASMVGMVSPCLHGGHAVILSTRGEVLWYEDLSDTSSGFLEAVDFTEDGTVLGMVDGGVTEVDLMGKRLLRLEPGVHLTERVHHDLFKRDGRVHVLFQEAVDFAGDVHLLDGFYVFDGAGARLGEWHLADHFTPPPGGNSPFPNDTSHANAIWVDAQGQALLSFRHLSGVMAVDADPASPAFGEVRWSLVGDPTSPLPNDLALSSDVGDPVDFFKQHNPHFLPDGRLTLFDNRESFIEPSRILDLEVDPVGATARIVGSWELPLHCDFQGGAQRTVAGNPLGTCAPYRRAYEFDEAAGGQPIWEAQATCLDSAISVYVPRYVPLEW